MMEPFIRMCQDRAKSSTSTRPAASARSRSDLADVVQVPDAGLAGRMSGTQLEQNVDERAAVVVLMFLEPVVKHVENRQQLFLGCVAAQP